MSYDVFEEVSNPVFDGWLANPPCTNEENSYCHVMCPYYDECFPVLDFDEDL